MNSNAFQRWNSDLANVIAHVGDSIFFQQVFAAIEAQVPVAYPQAWLYHKDLPPQLLDHKIPKDAYGSQVDEYLEGPYREDPFFKISLSAPRNNCYRLSRLVTGDFELSSSHRDYSACTGTVEEAIIVTRLADGSVINISLMRLASQGEFSEEEYNWLYSVSQCLAELIDLHTRREEFVESNLLQPELITTSSRAMKALEPVTSANESKRCWSCSFADTGPTQVPKNSTSHSRRCDATASPSIKNSM